MVIHYPSSECIAVTLLPLPATGVLRGSESFQHPTPCAQGPSPRLKVLSVSLLALILLPLTPRDTPAEEPITLDGHPGGVSAVAFSPDGKLFVSGDMHGKIELWTTNTFEEIRALPDQAGTIRSLVFSSDGKALMCAGIFPGVRCWDVPSGRERFTLTDAQVKFLALAISPDGKNIATGGTDGVIRFWDFATHNRCEQSITSVAAVLSLAYSPDGHFLASGDANGTLKLWNTRTAKEEASFKTNSARVLSVRFSPDGDFVVSGGEPRAEFPSPPPLNAWDIATRKPFQTPPLQGRSIEAVDFAPGARMLALGTRLNSTVHLLDFDAGKERSPLVGHQAFVAAVAFSPDGKLLASGSADRKIKIWRVSEK